ncbi:hypothetical protein B0H11DRAFT_2275376, partial [Mycena galericulata]
QSHTPLSSLPPCPLSSRPSLRPSDVRCLGLILFRAEDSKHQGSNVLWPRARCLLAGSLPTTVTSLRRPNPTC